jgi:signal transduction histidine kinase
VPDRRLQEPREAFEQFLTRDGHVLRATRGFTEPLLSRAELSRLHRPSFFTRSIAGVQAQARLLAVPLARTGPAAFLVVGVSTSDRRDALHELAVVLLVGGAGAVLVAWLAAWVVAGWALGPVDRMQQEAAAIATSGVHRRMTVPRARDELQRLACTLNDMLDRLHRSLTAERRFLERASHELRTPLTALRAEVDLSLRRPRTAAELTTALRGVSEETDRLARLADDLLVLARAEDGRLSLHREVTDLSELLGSAATLFAARATELGIALTVSAPRAATAELDPLRFRQLLVNLIDNALRHTPRGGAVHLTAAVQDDALTISVTDTGSGFATSTHPGDGEPGLGLRIVGAVADSHGGHVETATAPEGGARVDVVLPATPRRDGTRPTEESSDAGRADVQGSGRGHNEKIP